jgi:hypothetical protein
MGSDNILNTNIKAPANMENIINIFKLLIIALKILANKDIYAK